MEADMEPTLTAVELEKIRFGLQTRLSKEIANAEVRWYEDHLTDTIVFEVRGFVWAEKKSAKEFNYEFPADWWQAFKARWFPAWAKKRWPVQMQKIHIDVKAIYPEFRPAMPQEQYRLMIHKAEFGPMDYGKGYGY
jgi:hypothetical protein